MTRQSMVKFCRMQERRALDLEAGRRDMAASWLTGSDNDWRAAARGTGGPFVPIKRRIENARRDDRIAAKYSTEAAMFAAIAAELERP